MGPLSLQLGHLSTLQPPELEVVLVGEAGSLSFRKVLELVLGDDAISICKGAGSHLGFHVTPAALAGLPVHQASADLAGTVATRGGATGMADSHRNAELLPDRYGRHRGSS